MSRCLHACLSTVGLLVLAFGAIRCGLVAPELEVLAHNLASQVITNDENEDDWAYIYTVQVRNIGQAGRVRAKARISTPQGQFYREQIVTFAADERKVLRFVYTEPNFLADILQPETRSTYEFSYDVLR